MGASLACLTLEPEIERELRSLRRKGNAKASLVVRAEMILLAAEGH